MTPILLVAGGGLALGSVLTIWRLSPRRDAAGRFAPRKANLDGVAVTLKTVANRGAYMAAGFILAFMVMLWGAQ